ncbi:MAG TPA: hypothetical protein VLL08_31635 [Kineosporiaceae bacterium]|nr:hypothetical protein [Kineosporiaceae bacterium]
MSIGRRRLARRLVDGAVGVVDATAPWLSDRAYRAVAVPLSWVDPSGGARAAEARLDGIRDQVAGMATRGRVRPADSSRIQRDLARTRADLERISPRLSTVSTHGLSLRLAAYTEVLETLPGRPVAISRSARAQDAAILAGAVAAWIGVLLLVTNTTMAAVVIGLTAGVVTAIGIGAARIRRTGQARIGALASALGAIDETTGAPDRVDVRGLDRDRQALLRRAQHSGRLDERGVAALGQIDVHLDDLLIRLLEGDLEPDASHLVQATVTRYLPDTLEPFLALSDPQTVVRGRPAAVEVASQLVAIETGLADMARRPHGHPETRLLLQGEFLRSKFG